jgi:putative transposase
MATCQEAFPIQEDEHLLVVLRYVERNALRARLVRRAEQWRWCSLRALAGEPGGVPLHPGPAPRGDDWVDWVYQPQSEAELSALRTCIARCTPFGGESWQRTTADRLGLESSLRLRGRPRLNA